MTNVPHRLVTRLPWRRQPSAVAAIARLARRARLRGLDVELLPTDRLLERWAASQFGSVSAPHLARDPLATLALRPSSGVPPLPDDLAVLVDRIVIRSEDYPRRFVLRWYLRRWESVSALAVDLAVPREAIYGRWNATLWYMRRRFVDAALEV